MTWVSPTAFLMITSGLVCMTGAIPVYYGHGGGGGYGHGGGGYGHVVPAAVISHHDVKYYDVPSSGYVKPTTIDVPPNYLPVHFIFRSASSHVHVDQKHMGAPGGYKESYSKDEPHVLKHTVTKPIIQEVHEIISPYRKVVQTVEPVKEEIKTVVARGYGGGGGDAGYGAEGAVYGGGAHIVDLGHLGYGHGALGHGYGY